MEAGRGGGWGPEPRLYPDLLFSVAPDQGQRAGYRGWVQKGQCSGTAPLLWVPQLSADWRPPLSPRGGLQAWGGKHGHYLSPNSHSPSGPSFLGTGQTPSPQLLLAPREAGRGVPPGGGAFLEHTTDARVQVQAQVSLAPKPYGQAGMGSRSDISSWETGHRDITFHAIQESHPRAHLGALGFAGGATLDSKRNFILILETFVKSRPFPQPLREPI